MKDYTTEATTTNHQWSYLLAKAIWSARDKPGETTEQFIRPETIDLPYMLYQGMLEVVRLNNLLLPAMAAARVTESQAIMSKLDSLLRVFNSLPEIQLGTPADIGDKIDTVVARLNGRWPV
jgi:hypothetical protein